MKRWAHWASRLTIAPELMALVIGERRSGSRIAASLSDKAEIDIALFEQLAAANLAGARPPATRS
jgi:hypothetical protein